MLSKLRQKLPFGGGKTQRPYLDDAPLPFKPEPDKSEVSAGKKAEQARSTRTTTPEATLTRVRAERDALAQRLKRLETMLADPEKGQNAILYYRLRAIWDICERDLMALSKQFREKYASDKESHQAGGAQAASEALAAQLRAARARVRALQEERKQLDHALHRSERPFKVGEKQSLSDALARTEKRLEATTREIRTLQAREATEQTTSSERARQAVLTVQTKRAINTTLLALAQHFYLNYREEQIAEMALRAAHKSVDEVNFGLSSECMALGNKIRELVTRSKNEDDRHEMVRRRAEYLKGKLRYPNGETAIPNEHSVNSIPTRVSSSEGLFSNLGDEIPVNVLALDYWNVRRTLIE